MVHPFVTGLYAALNAIFNIFLASRVANLRGKHKVSIGDHPEMSVAIRTHGNNAEFVPLALIMILICELCGGSSALIHIMGGSLFVARIAHWIGLPRKSPNPYRFAGVAVTWLVILAASGYVLYLRYV